MNSCLIRHARIFDTAALRFFEGSVLVLQGRIGALSHGDSLTPPDGVPVFDAQGVAVIPGFVDVHTHGRAGGDFGTADRALMTHMARSYLDSGVTTLLPTLASAPPEELEAAIDRINSSVITELALLNTIPPVDASLSDRLKYLSVGPMFSEAIERIYQEVSISKLFR